MNGVSVGIFTEISVNPIQGRGESSTRVRRRIKFSPVHLNLQKVRGGIRVIFVQVYKNNACDFRHSRHFIILNHICKAQFWYLDGQYYQCIIKHNNSFIFYSVKTIYTIEYNIVPKIYLNMIFSSFNSYQYLFKQFMSNQKANPKISFCMIFGKLI